MKKRVLTVYIFNESSKFQRLVDLGSEQRMLNFSGRVAGSELEILLSVSRRAQARVTCI